MKYAYNTCTLVNIYHFCTRHEYEQVEFKTNNIDCDFIDKLCGNTKFGCGNILSQCNKSGEVAGKVFFMLGLFTLLSY